MAKSKKPRGSHLQFGTKKCPYCMTHLKLMDEKCYSCGAKVGEVNRLGFAEKPVNWKGYIISIVAWTGFVVYMWWAFFRD